MKNRLEIEPSMSNACHAVAVSSLDPPGPVFGTMCLPWTIALQSMSSGGDYGLLTVIVAMLLLVDQPDEADGMKHVSHKRSSPYACISIFSPCANSSIVRLPQLYGLLTVLP